MASDFEVGDTVVLKSGGSPMTVQKKLRDASVECVCFDPKDGTRRTDKFFPQTLEGYAPPPEVDIR